MGTGKSREDEVYEQGVHDGQKSSFADSVTDMAAMEVTLFDHALFEIYVKGYEYGQAHRPEPVKNYDPPERTGSSNEPSSEDSSGTGCIVKGVLVLIAIAAVLWFVFALALPLLVIDIAAIALIVGLTRKEMSKFLLPLSVAGAVLVVADHNQGWFTKALAKNVPFLAGIVPVLLYINILAGLIAAYFMIRAFMNKRNPPTEDSGEFTKRNLIAMGGLLLVGALTVGLQVTADLQRSHARMMSYATPVSNSDGATTTPIPSPKEARPAVAQDGAAFIGDWDGYAWSHTDKGVGGQINNLESNPTAEITVTKEKSKYRVLLKLQGGNPEGMYAICSYVHGKIVADGDSKEFYKYEIPELVANSDGSLTYKDGSSELRLKKAHRTPAESVGTTKGNNMRGNNDD